MKVDTASKSPARFICTIGLPLRVTSNGPPNVGLKLASRAVPPWRTISTKC